jgi:hypothetical protein
VDAQTCCSAVGLHHEGHTGDQYDQFGVQRMVYRGSNEARRLPIRQIAQLLIQAGQEDPTLLSRAQTSSADRLSDRGTESPEAARTQRPLSSTDQHLAAEADPYMEQLVSIAIASARRAENAYEYASKTGKIAKRATTVIAVFGVIGGLVGIAGIVDHRFNGRLKTGLATVTSDVHQSSTAQMPDAMVGGVPTTTNNVMTRSAVGRLDERPKTTAAQATSQVLQTKSLPTAGVQAYPTWPYGLNASTSQGLASRRSGLDQPHPAETVLSRLRAQERQASTAPAVAAQPSGLSEQPQQQMLLASETSFPPPQIGAQPPLGRQFGPGPGGPGPFVAHALLGNGAAALVSAAVAQPPAPVYVASPPSYPYPYYAPPPLRRVYYPSYYHDYPELIIPCQRRHGHHAWWKQVDCAAAEGAGYELGDED